MTTSSQQDPLQLLREIERRCREYSLGLPLQVEVKEEWLGIGFRLGRHKLLAPLDEVVEILHYPTLSKVPGAKPWCKGIANVRGNLLPVMDLQAFLGGETVGMNRRSRVLVMNRNGIYSGLVVDEVLGLKHFLEEELSTEMPEVDTAVMPYLSKAYTQGGALWGVFSMQKLAEDPSFLQVAV